jgi:hypothetical protein
VDVNVRDAGSTPGAGLNFSRVVMYRAGLLGYPCGSHEYNMSRTHCRITVAKNAEAMLNMRLKTHKNLLLPESVSGVEPEWDVENSGAMVPGGTFCSK